MQIVAIGKPLFEERTELPEAVEYSYQSGEHTLLLSMNNLHPKEIEAVREAEAEFGLYCEKGIVFLLYRFGDALPWSDSAFSWWNIAEASNGIVKAIRVTTLSPDFTEKLHDAIREQAAGEELSRAEFVKRSLKVYENRTPSDLAAKAIVKTKGGE
jgi:hypothetical protein